MGARQALAWLGRHGSSVIALGVFAGLLMPPLAALLRPLLIAAIARLVAMAQLPIYTLPMLQCPLYRRWLAGPPGAGEDHAGNPRGS